MRAIEVTFSDGRTVKTDINGTIASIHRYYLLSPDPFNFGDTEEHPKDLPLRAVKLVLLDRTPPKAVAYVFPNGFADQARSMYTCLRHYNLSPEWAGEKDGTHVILLPPDHLDCLRLMQNNCPARFGAPPPGWTPPKETK